MAKVALILTPGFADWEYAYIAGTGVAYYGIDVRFFSPTPGRFSSQGGLNVAVHEGLQHCLDWQPNVVGIIGGQIWEGTDAPELTEFLLQSRSNGATIAGICGGTLALARAGLLDTIPHTSNSIDFLEKNAQGYKGAALYQESRRAIAAERVITAPGPAPISFTCAVFEAAGLQPEVTAQLSGMLASESI
ncbi:DJ-1/PfpI family protein [Pseudoduganella violacea]|uniref:Putative intracellular protease/amidase n=1 Tax=Pseudoduganella violacea TaxID=1715466 RepID=A0A7W5BG18_9BURK|nr:DJ-1/PfpI family protein [Pseudoduganella violacea]MBB3122185.1 putative intracellular protease/amidase [Pseudoduganella violacea]